MTVVVDAETTRRVRAILSARAGIEVPPARAGDLARAIERAAERIDAEDVGEVWRALAAVHGPRADAALEALIAGLNVGETHFFRDRAQLHGLSSMILPELIEKRRRERTLRVWSAGCSTGEEPYTIAMILHDLIEDVSSWRISILATDINTRSLERAKEGVYRTWSFRGLSPADVRHVMSRGDAFVVSPEIRQLVTFRRLNLAEPVYPSASTGTNDMDLVLCRNVLLYMDRAQARRIVAGLWSALAPAGRLVVSRVDAGLPIFDGIAADAPGSGIFTKRPRQRAESASSSPAPGPGRARVARGDGAGEAPVPARVPSRPSGTHVAGSADASAAAKVVDAARAAIRAERWRDAEQIVRMGLDREPRSAELQYLDGMVSLAANDDARAVVAFRRAIYVEPGMAVAHLAQGVSLARLGRTRRARAALERAALLVEGLPSDALVPHGEGLRAGELLEMVDTQRRTLVDAGAASA